MSTKFTLDVTARDRAGKGVARTLRREGRIPAVIYGGNQAPAMISLDSNTVNVMYRKGHMGTSIGTLNMDGKKHMVIARDIALHPVTDVIEHIDFLRVSEKTTITVNVPLHIVGQDKSPAMSKKAVVTYAHHEISVDCQATNIPEHIDVDISKLDVGAIVHAGDLKLPSGVSLHGNIAEQNLLTLELPRILSDELDASTPDTIATAEKTEEKEGE